MLRIRQVPLTDPDVQVLVEEVQAEYVVRYGGPDESVIDAKEFDPPTGAFFVGYLDGIPLAMGGWRRRPDVRALDGTAAAEIKRMYVAPPGRRNGLARVVLARLEESARSAGADLMVLETGIMQPEAIGLYTTSGYTPVHAFGYYAWSPNSRYFGKRLPTACG